MLWKEEKDFITTSVKAPTGLSFRNLFYKSDIFSSTLQCFLKNCQVKMAYINYINFSVKSCLCEGCALQRFPPIIEIIYSSGHIQNHNEFQHRFASLRTIHKIHVLLVQFDPSI